MLNQNLLDLRHELHRNPEVSNQEFETSKRITDFVKNFNPDEVISLGKTGKAFVFNGTESGPTTMFRAELDALPINETGTSAYKSLYPNAAHSCGHDGHMTILVGLAEKISINRPLKGKAVLLFQPAEEVEQGAVDVLNDANFKSIEPDYLFALHNVPGIEINTVLYKSGAFCAASKGLTVKLTGKTSHAAEPEKGISPAVAISKLITGLNKLMANKQAFSNVTLLTIIHIELGEISFGTSPGYAEFMVTLRAFENSDMKVLTKKVEGLFKRIAKKENLGIAISYSEVFPAVENNVECVDFIQAAVKETNVNANEIYQPFRWSEDFAYFTQKYKGGYFGLGAGINQPELHHPNYDFPDEIIETGIKIFEGIYKKINF